MDEMLRSDWLTASEFYEAYKYFDDLRIAQHFRVRLRDGTLLLVTRNYFERQVVRSPDADFILYQPVVMHQ